MLGPPRQSSAELFIYNFDLEDRIPADHPLRRVRELVEFDFVRPLVRRFYGYNGHPSEDPVVILKLMFLLFFDNVSSERELLRQVGYRMDYLWFLGMGVHGPIPHPSVLSKARRRWGKEIFEALFVGVVRQHERNTQEAVKTVVADRQYGTQDNLAWCGKVGIESDLGEFPQPRVEEILGVEQFRWDEQRDCYWCPAGQALTRQPERNKKKRIRLYRASRRVCQACPLYAQGTRSRKGIRKIARHFWQDEIDRARAQSRSPAARRSRVRRRSLLEGSFADAANNHHFKRSRWRGLARQRIQDYLIGVCRNVRLMLRHSGRRLAWAAARAALLQGLDRGIAVLRSLCCPGFRHAVGSAGPV